MTLEAPETPVEAPSEAPGSTPSPAPEAPSAASTGPEWLQSIPEDIRDAKTWQPYLHAKDASEALGLLAKSHVSLEKMIGAENRVGLPGEGEDITQWQGWDKLGVPKDAAGYAEALKRPELPEGANWNEDMEKSFLDLAAKNRMHPAHVQAVYDMVAEANVAEAEAAKQAAAEDQREYDRLAKEEWGSQKERMEAFASRAAEQFGLDGEELDLLSSKGGSFKIANAFAKIGEAFAEAGQLHGKGESTLGLTREQAVSEIEAINARLQRGETVGADEMKRRSKLFEIAYPGKLGQ